MLSIAGLRVGGIADFRLPIDSGGYCHAAFPIDNQQSATKTRGV
jgi:hypothetical protein